MDGGGHLLSLFPLEMLKSVFSCKCCLKPQWTKYLCIILRKCRQFLRASPRDPHRVAAPGPCWGTSVLQAPSLPTPEKNPAGTHRQSWWLRITVWRGRLFHSFTTRWLKKCFLRSSLVRCFAIFKLWPLVWYPIVERWKNCSLDSFSHSTIMRYLQNYFYWFIRPEKCRFNTVVGAYFIWIIFRLSWQRAYVQLASICFYFSLFCLSFSALRVLDDTVRQSPNCKQKHE